MTGVDFLRMLERFRETLAENITVMITVYVVLAGIIAIGVVYNSARIALSERARELATLRVIGEAIAPKTGFGQLEALHHGAHSAIQDEDARAQKAMQL